MKFVMPIEGKSAEELYNLNSTGSGGFYPIGLNNSYHGGMHFEGARHPVVAIADGTIVAYRLTSEYIEERSGGKTYKYSNCFVLIKHEYKTPKGQEFTFYSHYNHLAPWNDLTSWMPENGRYPHFVVKPGYKIIKREGVAVYKTRSERSVNRLSKTLKNKECVVASPVTGTREWAKIEGAEEYFIWSRNNAERKMDVVCIPELDKVVSKEIPVKAGTIIGYSGLCEAEGAPGKYAAVHVEVFADNDAEDFINNIKADGKASLLKLAEGKELKQITKKYTDLSVLTKCTRNKGTEVQIIKEEGVWAQVKDVNFVGEVEYAWLIDKYDTHKSHFTVNNEYLEQVKAQFPDVDIDGEEATNENKGKETPAAHFKYKSGRGTTTRIITVAAKSPKQYWIKKAFLKNAKEINAENCELWSDNPDTVEVINGSAVPYHCVVPSNEQITKDNVVWHRVEIGGIGGWVKEPDVIKVSPYDWLKCNFGLIKEQKDDSIFSIFRSGSESDSQINYERLPTFFQQIFDRIDTNHDKIISDQELQAVIRDPRWARYLARMICYHQTEWYADGHGEEVERVKRQLGQDAAERLKARIRQMCWWDDVSERPSSKQLYHWGPVAFVEQMTNIHLSSTVVWGGKVSVEFKQKVFDICERLGMDPNYLMAAMAWESGETFSPTIPNGAGSGAIGLIQFMPSTAIELGTTTAKLVEMTAVEQLDYVEKYFLPYKGKCKTLEDVYMAILWPAAIGEQNSYVLFSQGSKAYQQNRGIDRDGDGRGTKGEAAACVRDKLEKGRQFEG